MKYALLLALTNTSCTLAGIRCEYETKGICLIFESELVEEDDISQSIVILQEELNKYYTKRPNIAKLFGDKDTTVKFVDYDLQANCHITERNLYRCKNISGVNYFHKDIYVEWRRCFGQSAFIHELLHTVENKMYNINASGSKHQAPLFEDHMKFPQDAIENKANMRIQSEICFKPKEVKSSETVSSGCSSIPPSDGC